jgi:hypothetical protein
VLDVVGSLVVVGIWAYCLFDAVTADASRVRRLPKFLWIVLILLLFLVGALAWLLLGRPKADYAPADAAPRRRVVGPEDAPDFEERIRRGMRGPGGNRPNGS